MSNSDNKKKRRQKRAKQKRHEAGMQCKPYSLNKPASLGKMFSVFGRLFAKGH